MAPAQSTRTRSGIEEGRGEWLPALRQTAGAGMAARRSAGLGARVLQALAMVETERQGVQSATKTWPIPEETVLAVGGGGIRGGGGRSRIRNLWYFSGRPRRRRCRSKRSSDTVGGAGIWPGGRSGQ